MYKPFLEAYTRAVIDQGIKQKIYWQEWRSTFFSFKGATVFVENSESDKWTAFAGEKGIKKHLNVIKNVIDEKVNENTGFKGAVVIWCLSREFEPETVINNGQIGLLNKIRSIKGS